MFSINPYQEQGEVMKWTTGTTVLAIAGGGLVAFVAYKAFMPTPPVYVPPTGGSQQSMTGGTDYFASFIRGAFGGIGDIVRSGNAPSGNSTTQSGNPSAGYAAPSTGVAPTGSNPTVGWWSTREPVPYTSGMERRFNPSTMSYG